MYKIDLIGLESSSILSKLWKDTFVQAYSDVHTPDNIDKYCMNNFSIAKARSELKNDDVICKVAKTKGTAVGFYLLKEHDCPVLLEGRSTELKQIYILSKHYRQGLGKLLYEDAVSTVLHRGSQHIWLCVSDINDQAKDFYRKLGFTAVGHGPIFEVGTDRLTSSIMMKDL